MPTGYSGTPLARKLGLREGTALRAIDPPQGYRDLLAPLPPGVRFVSRVSTATDVVHLFVHRRSELRRALARLRSAIRPDAAIWVSWPKKSSGAATDLSEDGIREEALPLGLVDVKVCAVDDTWSGLKLVIRRELR